MDSAKVGDRTIAAFAARVRAILKQPDFVEHQITSKGLEVIASTPQEFADVVQQENVSLKTMIDAAGIQPE